ncbi:MAG TPA: phosphate ABC transporter substrate-binding protein PstS [Lacipirellulaceae bacterium]|jgi:phosphate transport system substrate-binding protein|nr:phosphate ABC transporter substrate-binding protein PstS [Lacipirellulaceae bacterium]
MRWVVAASAVVVAAASSCSAARAATRLQGAGATFPAPFYKRLVVIYQQLHPNVLIDYQSIGSGGGIRAITDRTVNFCGSDAPMTKRELATAGGDANIVEVPSCAGGVVAIYNVPGLKDGLKISGELLADIYLGKVSHWNDPAIAALNPGVDLPSAAITPVWRTDASGTTFVFTNYLGTQAEEFITTIGAGKQVQWPFGQGGKGNEGVTAVVQQTEGGIGYVEQSYADNNHLLSGALKNKAGKFVKASPDTVSKAGAAAEFKKGESLLACDIWNQAGDEAYPIASFTYLIVYKDLKNLPDKNAAQDLADFLWWTTHEGQRYATDLGYAPLAPEVQAKVEKAFQGLTFRGEPLRIGGK